MPGNVGVELMFFSCGLHVGEVLKVRSVAVELVVVVYLGVCVRLGKDKDGIQMDFHVDQNMDLPAEYWMSTEENGQLKIEVDVVVEVFLEVNIDDGYARDQNELEDDTEVDDNMGKIFGDDLNDNEELLNKSKELGVEGVKWSKWELDEDWCQSDGRNVCWV